MYVRGVGVKKIGIITFHHSYNCGSMMQAFALQSVVQSFGFSVEIIDFSNCGQKLLYRPFFANSSIKNIIKNLILIPHITRIKNNNKRYEDFIKKYFVLSKKSYSDMEELEDDYYAVIAGSDQIWNVTIADSDDAYFLPWVNNGLRIAYAPSFGARNVVEYSKDPEKYIKYLKRFDAISIRENNGRMWLKEFMDIDAPVVLDPTLLLDESHYSNIYNSISTTVPDRYIFYYSPNYDKEIIRLVNKVSKKYNMPVVAFNSKSFFVKMMWSKGFVLPNYEDPAIYLKLIKFADMVFTTSFHGAVFSSIFKKNFWIVKNGGMFSTDDRIISMTSMLDLNDRIIPIRFDDKFDYCSSKDYTEYERRKDYYKLFSKEFLVKALSCDEKRK